MPLGEAQTHLLSTSRNHAFLAEQQLFSQWLGYVRKNEIYDLPDYTMAINHEGHTTEGLERDLGIGFYASVALHEEWNQTRHQRPPARLSFEPQPLLRIGREDSRHHVFFGTVTQEWFDGTRDALQVAVKPFPGNARDIGMHELAMYQYLKARELPTLEMLGALAVPAKQTERTSLYLVSRYRPGIATMDNLRWSEMAPQVAWDHIGRVAVPTLIALHTSSPEDGDPDVLVHGDTSLRNMAFSDVGDEPFVIDAEFMVSAMHLLHPAFPRDALVKLLSRDFRELTSSANDVILAGQKLSDTERFEEDYQHIYLPYYEQLAKSSSLYKATLMSVWEQIVDQHARQASGEW